MIVKYYIANSNKIIRANMGYIETERHIYFFDTTYDSSYFEKKIKDVAFKEKKITLIISHKHKDHYGGLNLDVVRYFDRIIASNEFLNELENVNSFQILKQDHMVLDNGIEVFMVLNGHTDKDIVLHDIHNEVAFMGDLLLQNRHPLLNAKNIEARLDIYQRLLNLGVKRFVPGHGSVISDYELKEYINYLTFISKCRREYLQQINFNVENILNNSIYRDWKYPENFEKSIVQ